MEPNEIADPAPPVLPVGRSGRLEAMALQAAGDHAVLVRETGSPNRGRALLTTDKLAAGERLVVMPLDDEVEVRVDGDALAVWLGSGSIQQVPPEQRPIEHAHVAPWATIVGGALMVLVLVFAVIGSGVAFSWLMAALQ
ncbi:MAG TPA: hypothetical protein VF365_06245 [Candidatus Limnocylindria bacterium]